MSVTPPLGVEQPHIASVAPYIEVEQLIPLDLAIIYEDPFLSLG
jgi:hypothetical protein